VIAELDRQAQQLRRLGHVLDEHDGPDADVERLEGVCPPAKAAG